MVDLLLSRYPASARGLRAFLREGFSSRGSRRPDNVVPFDRGVLPGVSVLVDNLVSNSSCFCLCFPLSTAQVGWCEQESD